MELESLGRAEFVRILKEPQNALLLQYRSMLATEGIELVFEDEAVETIAAIAEEVNTRTENIGARRLHTVMERLLETISFEASEPAYKPLKAALEGSLSGLPENVLLYATSNRRHLLPEHFSDNREAHDVDGEIHPGDAVEEKIVDAAVCHAFGEVGFINPKGDRVALFRQQVGQCRPPAPRADNSYLHFGQSFRSPSSSLLSVRAPGRSFS